MEQPNSNPHLSEIYKAIELEFPNMTAADRDFARRVVDIVLEQFQKTVSTTVNRRKRPQG